MANFLETQTPTFSKLAPFPVDMYGKVGMMKQAMYDANTAKVQGYYDSIAALDLAKDTDKAYLNQKLTQLQTDLGALAGADFSKQSVVNQAAGMAGPISKDQTILQGVMATSQMRKSDKEMESARKDGKNGPSNDWDYATKRNAWLNDGQTGSAFNAQYSQYTDVTKKLVDGLKSYNVNVTAQDIAYDPVTGQLNTAMIREKTKGMSPEQLTNIISVVLDDRDYKQLDMDSRYKLQGYDAPSLSKVITDYQANTSAQLQAKIDEMTATASTSTGATKASIEKGIESMKKSLASVGNNTTSYLDRIQKGDIEGAKSQFGTQSFIDRFAHGMSYTEYERQIIANPIADYNLKRAELEMQDRHFWATQDRLWAQGDDDGTGTGRGGGRRKKGEEDKPPPTIPNGLGNYTSVVPGVTVNKEKVENGIVELREQIAKGKGSMIDRFYTSDPKNPNGGEAWYATQRKLYDEGASNLNTVMKEHFKAQEVMEGDLDARLYTYGEILGRADNKFPIKQVTEELPEDLKFINTKDGNQQAIAFTADEAIALKRKYDAFEKDVFAHKVDISGGRYNKFIPTLSEREKLLMNRANLGHIAGPYGGGRDDVSGQFWKIIDHTQQKYDVITKGKDDFIEGELKAITGLGARQHLNLAIKTDEQTAMQAMVNAYSADREQTDMGVGTEGINNKADLAKINKIMSGTNVTYNLTVERGKGLVPDQYSIIVSGTGKEGKAVQHAYIPITADQKAQLFGVNFEHGATGEFQEGVQTRLIQTRNSTTNPRGIKTDTPESLNAALVNPYLKRAHFPQVSIFSVKGDILTGNGPTNVNAQLYVYQPLSTLYNPVTKKQEAQTPGWRVVELNTNKTMDYGSLSMALSQLTDAQVFERVYGRPPVDQSELDKVKQAATRTGAAE